MNNLAGFVLAGGKSSRMGRDKALLPWKDETLLSHALELANSVAAPVSIVGDPAKCAEFGRVVEDIHKECGPLGGIHAALSSSTADLNLILAVDVPLVSVDFLRFLAERASSSSASAVVPFAGGGWQPLCAVYRKEFAAIADEALRQKHYKIDSLFHEVTIERVDELEIRMAGFSPEMFRNLNTPEEFEQATRPAL